MEIQALQPSHYEAVKKIYLQGIEGGHATFQTEAPTWEDWNKSHLLYGRLVLLDNNHSVTGWAALSPVSDRCVYAGVAEVSIYIHHDHQGKGLGKQLLKALILESQKENIWTLQAGVFPENQASLKIHLQCGFRQIGYREKIGKLKGVWRDTLLLELRSQIVGT